MQLFNMHLRKSLQVFASIGSIASALTSPGFSAQPRAFNETGELLNIGNLSAIENIAPCCFPCADAAPVTSTAGPEDVVTFETNIGYATLRVRIRYPNAQLFSLVAYPKDGIKTPTQGSDFKSIRLTYEYFNAQHQSQVAYIQTGDNWRDWKEPEPDTHPRAPDYATFDFGALHTHAVDAIALMTISNICRSIRHLMRSWDRSSKLSSGSFRWTCRLIIYW